MLALDQFFTKKDVAESCWKDLCLILRTLTSREIGELFFIEPSAGDGAFYDLLLVGKEHCIGIDIVPRRGEFLACDFLTWNPAPHPATRQNIVVIGNPPFGKRGKMAVQFLNHAAEIADTVAFIVPVIFRKYFIHKQIDPELRWIHSTKLRRDAFWTVQKKTYTVNTEFQVWTRLPNSYEDKRLNAPPPISHRDFYIWQYNNTKEALKVFKNDFDFAVPSQGWQDYTRREEDANRCEKHKQWMLFKAFSPKVRDRLHKEIDYDELAKKNTTSIPGFRKGDLVQEYIHRYDQVVLY